MSLTLECLGNEDMRGERIVRVRQRKAVDVRYHAQLQ